MLIDEPGFEFEAAHLLVIVEDIRGKPLHQNPGFFSQILVKLPEILFAELCFRYFAAHR